jgi:signal transduction histidine kinase
MPMVPHPPPIWRLSGPIRAYSGAMSPRLPPEPSSDVRTETQRRQLQRVADALAWSLEPGAVAAQLIEAACNTLGAPMGWVAVRSEEGGEAVVLASHGFTEAAIGPWQRVPIGAEVPMTIVMRTGRAMAHASAEERLRDFPALAIEGRPTRYVEASAVVPMTFEGTTMGALALTFDEVKEIHPSDLWFLEQLAAYGAGALERARLFAAVRERDTRLKIALGASGLWVWTWDLDTDHVVWAPEPPDFAMPAGDGRDAQNWIDLIHPDDRERVDAGIAATLKGEGSYEVEFRVGEAGGPVRWILGTGSIVTGASGRPRLAIGTTRDITERKEAELEHNRRIEAEREAARLRDAFIGVVSHELRTPITTIFGGTRVLARRWHDMEPGARDALLGDVAGEADRLFRMVEDLLVLTRVERGSLDVGDEPVALRPVVERVLASERARSPQVAFEARLPAELPLAEGEEMYVEQVLRNLLSNAAKYGGAGSVVTVEAAGERDAVVLRVLDEGPGIVEGEAEQIFEVFYRSPSTAPKAAGAGIGLFVCRQLAIAMGGTMRAHNRAEGGAAFELRLRRFADDGVA